MNMMKIKDFILKSLITVTLIFSTLQANAQTLEIGMNQTLSTANPGFFQFSTTSNDLFKDVFPTNPNLEVQISNFLGGPCAIAPAADFSEVGQQIIITGNTGNNPINLNFSSAAQNAGLFGVSLVPQNGNCFFDIFLEVPESPPPPSTSSSSSSGIISTGLTNQELITNAINQEKDALKNLTISSSGFSVQSALSKINTSLDNLNELESMLENPSKLIQEKLNCAKSKDNEAKSVLLTIQDTSPDPGDKLFTKTLSKIRVAIRKAIRCKKNILKKITTIQIGH